MLDKRLNIFVAGLGWSGNSATYDFFRNFTDVAFCENEFDIFRTPNYHMGEVLGPMDIVCKFSRNKDIRGDIEKFREFYHLLGVFWYNNFSNEYFHVLDRLCEIFSNFYDAFHYSLSINSHNVNELPTWSKRLTQIVAHSMDDLFNSYKPDKKLGLFRHVVRSWESIDKQLPFLPPKCKIIITNRDPRDSWVDMNNDKKWFSRFGTSIDDFISSRERNYKCFSSKCDRVMHIRFEDLCLHYHETRKKLMDFVGLDENSSLNSQVYFNADTSLQHIGIYKNFENKDDISKIEEALPELLWRE